MKDNLAVSLLSTVLRETDLELVSAVNADLQVLATVKYDEYQGYRPGVKFIESLALWLEGFDPEDRHVALDFVRRKLVFVSSAEMDHLVSTVYPDIIHPRLLSLVAAELSVPRWSVTQIEESAEFRAARRRMMILGMSDGARLDILRRSSPFSTEQFHLVPQIDLDKARDMRDDLEEVMDENGWAGERKFSTVVLVDDFSASGTSMLRKDDEKNLWKGKLQRARARLDELGDQGVLSADHNVTVLVYMMTTKAYEYMMEAMETSGLRSRGYELLPAHVLEPAFPLSDERDSAFLGKCLDHYRDSWRSKHTAVGGENFALGYADCAIPLVLHHNTPNNTPPIIWRDELTDPSPDNLAGAREWVGLFPRHERHHASRP